MGGTEGARPAPGGDETFVGYHGTSSVFTRDIQRAIAPRAGRNFEGRTQWREGFYVTEDYVTALDFARNAAIIAGGTPVVLKVYARDFGALKGEEVPGQLWWKLTDDSSYLTDFDFLTAPVAGYEPVQQIKFNPRAYSALSAR